MKQQEKTTSGCSPISEANAVVGQATNNGGAQCNRSGNYVNSRRNIITAALNFMIQREKTTSGCSPIFEANAVVGQATNNGGLRFD